MVPVLRRLHNSRSQSARSSSCDQSLVEEGLSDAGCAARCRVEAERLYVAYEPMFEASGFVAPEVIVEFGARSTGEPHANRPVVCDAAAYLPGITFPEAHPTVMLPERTFWEKATAIHVFCRQERRRSERLSRHWHDLARLDEAGIAASALADHGLALSVARHEATFFTENDARGNRIDYEAVVSGGLQLVPSGAAYAVLADGLCEDAGRRHAPRRERTVRCTYGTMRRHRGTGQRSAAWEQLMDAFAEIL